MEQSRGRGRGSKGRTQVPGRGGASNGGNQFTSARGRGRGRSSRVPPHPRTTHLDWNSFYRLGTTQNIPAAVEELLPESIGGGSQWDTPHFGEENDPHADNDLDMENDDDSHQSDTPDPPTDRNYDDVHMADYQMPRSYPYQTNERPRTEFVRGGSSNGTDNINEETILNIALVGAPADYEDDHRVLIVPVGKKSFDPHEVIRDIAARCIIIDYQPGWTGMRQIPQVAFDRWFNRFSQIARWAPEHNLQVCHNFRRKCGEIIRNSWASFRAGRSKKGHAFSDPDILAANILKFKNDPTFKALSEQNKKNCKGERSDRGHSTHRGGPKPAEWHHKQLTLELGRPPTAREMYDRLQRKANGGYFDPEGHRILARYEKKLRARIGNGLNSDPITKNEDMEIFASEAGFSHRDKFPRVFGAAATLIPGSRFQPHPSPSSRLSLFCQPGSIDPAIAELMKSFSESIEMKLKSFVKEIVQESLQGQTGVPDYIPSPPLAAPTIDADMPTSNVAGVTSTSTPGMDLDLDLNQS